MRGGQWQAVYLLEGLAARGHAAALLARSGSPLYAEARGRGLEVHPLSAWSVARRSPEYELIHAHDARSHTLASLFAARPLVVSRRVAFPVKTTFASSWKYRRAAQFVAVSQAAAEALRAAGLRQDRINVVYDGIAASGDAPPLSVRPARVVALASEDPAKGADLIRAAARLSGIEVIFSRDLAADLGSAAVFVYVSRSEGLGSAALLAMAFGTPVVASRVGGLPEVVEHQTTGLLTENDPEQIAAAMRLLLTNRDLAGSLAARALQRVRDRFSLSRMVDGTLAVYERILR